MKKKLSQMTLEELWELFPIFLAGHQDCWAEWFEKERNTLREILPAREILRISHIGSTAVKTIQAKPIVDILVETVPGSDWSILKESLLQAGYLCMSESRERMSFNKGYTEDGFAQKVYHLHLRRKGDHDELYFRDYLMENPETAKEYEALKLSLWKRFEHNRDAYTESKTEFVQACTREAKKRYANRYEENSLR